MGIETILILIGCGCFSNLMSALFGIGGGVLMVPILMTIFPQMSIQQVSATSLSIVIGTALINLTYFIRQHISISAKNLAFWSVGMIVGVQAGFELSFLVHKFVIIAVFVTAMAFLSIKTFLMYRAKTKLLKSQDSQVAAKSGTTKQEGAELTTEAAKTSATPDTTPSKEATKASFGTTKADCILGSIFCTLGGGIAGFTGVGGGSILSPIISQLRSVKHAQIAVYTNYMMVIGGLGSMYSYLIKETPNLFEGTFQIGYINFNIIGIVLLASFCTSFVSMKLRHILKERIANLLLAYILAFIAVYTVSLSFLQH